MLLFLIFILFVSSKFMLLFVTFYEVSNKMDKNILPIVFFFFFLCHFSCFNFLSFCQLMLTDVMHMLSAIHWVPEDRITLFTADGLIQIGGSLVPRQFPAYVCYLSLCNLKYCSYHASNEDFLFSLFLKFKLNLYNFCWLSFHVPNYWFSELLEKKKKKDS